MPETPARLLAIFTALIKAVRRDLRSLGSFSGNNLFLAGVAFLFLKDEGVFAAITAFIGLVIFIPLSADPFHVVPADRLELWPLTARERVLLRVVSPWLNPVTWFIAALAFWKRVTMGLCALVAAIFAIGFVLPSLPAARKGLWRHVPHFPGPLDQLIRKNLRETLSTLDFWGGVLLSIISTGFRGAGLLPHEALLPMSIAVMLALSTYSQALFGLDGASGMTRYRLLPVPGWQILAAKDAAFLLVSVLLTLPLAPLAGAAAALCALATGHGASVNGRIKVMRWRFASSASFGNSMIQVVAICASAAWVESMPALLAACAAWYAWSTWRSGRAMDSILYC